MNIGQTVLGASLGIILAALGCMLAHGVWNHLRENRKPADFLGMLLLIGFFGAIVGGVVCATEKAFGASDKFFVQMPETITNAAINIPTGVETGSNITTLESRRRMDDVVFVDDDVTTKRRELANEIFEFLRLHALQMEEDPFQWVYDGAYELHLAAKELYSDKALKDIKVPVSEWKRGGYKPYFNPVTFLQHETLLARIYLLIIFGKNGVPPQQAKR